MTLPKGVRVQKVVVSPCGRRGEWHSSGLRPSVPRVVVQGCVRCRSGEGGRFAANIKSALPAEPCLPLVILNASEESRYLPLLTQKSSKYRSAGRNC